MDEARSHLLHRHALELVRSVGDGAIDARQRSTPQLLRTLRRDIDEKKSTRDRCCAFVLPGGSAFSLQFLGSHG